MKSNQPNQHAAEDFGCVPAQQFAIDFPSRLLSRFPVRIGQVVVGTWVEQRFTCSFLSDGFSLRTVKTTLGMCVHYCSLCMYACMYVFMYLCDCDKVQYWNVYRKYCIPRSQLLSKSDSMLFYPLGCKPNSRRQFDSMRSGKVSPAGS